MHRILGIILWVTLVPSVCIAQEDNLDRKSSFVFGGDFLWNSRHDRKEDRGFKRNDLTLNGKIGYFFLIMIFFFLGPE